MPVLLCLTCGAPAESPTIACPECGLLDAGQVEAPPPSDRDARLLERVVDTLRAKSELGPDEQQRTAAVRTRLDGQVTLLRARLASNALPPDEREQAFLDYALARVERALADLDS